MPGRARSTDMTRYCARAFEVMLVNKRLGREKKKMTAGGRLVSRCKLHREQGLGKDWEGIGHGLCEGLIQAFAWSDFGKPWETEIRMAGPGIEPRPSRMRVQCVIGCSRLLSSHHGDPGSIPGRATPDFRMWESCRTMPLVGGAFSGISRFPRPLIPALLHTKSQSPSSALKTSMLRTVQIYSLARSLAHAIPYVSRQLHATGTRPRADPKLNPRQMLDFVWGSSGGVRKCLFHFTILIVLMWKDESVFGTRKSFPTSCLEYSSEFPGFPSSGVEDAENPRPSRLLLTVLYANESKGAVVAERLARLPPTKARSRFNLRPGHSGFFRMWESCRTMPLIGGFSRGSPVFPRSFLPALLHNHRLSRRRY
ncbi:hypothetical protein PR048_033540 [Dryococelus australis]|uniref:Uncharacterized protein n=1 Tax=Dryococelus australis TaxID=614101 RepID=A0ABQ9G0K8_9NEOP|nr:hypothetical protein PR048_033540 [Dryococelus australis]